MFEAYRVGISLALDNKLSAPLRAITKELMEAQQRFAAFQKSIAQAATDSGRFVGQINATQKAIDRLNTAMGKTPKSWGAGINAPGGPGIPGAPGSPGGKPPGGGGSKRPSGKSAADMGYLGYQMRRAGEVGFFGLERSYESAKDYQTAFAQFQSLNLGDAVNTQADRFARGAQVIGASATDLIATARDLTTVLGDPRLAQQLAPGFAQLKFANQAVYGGHGIDFDEGQLRSLERIIEMKGGFKTPQEFLAQASMMQQVISGTGGMVKPSDYMNFIKTAGVSGRLLSDKSFYYGMEPLIQEMGGARVGTGLMSAYNNLAQGRSTVRAATELMRLGLLDPKMVEYTKIGTIKQVRPGALQDTAGFGANPYGWMQNTLLPALSAKGITTEQGVLQEMGVIFGNRTASALFSLMYMQQEKINKNMALSQNAMSSDQLIGLARSSPTGAETAARAAWENVKTAAGQSILPAVVRGLVDLAAGLREVGAAITRHPVRFKYLIEGLAGLAGALAFGGSVLVLASGFRTLGGILALGSGASVVGNVVALTSKLGLLGAAALAVYGLIENRDKVGGFLHDHAPGFVGRWYDNVSGELSRGFRNPLAGASDWLNGRAVTPPPANKSVAVTTIFNVDGRKIAENTTYHQTMALSRGGMSTPQSFDARMTPMPVGGM